MILALTQQSQSLGHGDQSGDWTNKGLTFQILDRQQKIVDDLASKFRNIVVLAASGGEKDDVTGQEAASKMLNINFETQGLVSSILHFSKLMGGEE